MTRGWIISIASAAGLLLVSGKARGDEQRFDRMLASSRVSPARGPTLEETQQWLQEKTAAYGVKRRGAIRESIAFEGCQARQVEEICSPDGKTDCVPIIHSFSLADLRASVSTGRGDGAGTEVLFTSCLESERGEVRTRRGEGETGSTHLCFSLRDEDNLRSRFARALTHAIELCQEQARRERASKAASAPPKADEPF